MFEQSLYETEPVITTEPVATPLESGDLFHTYEIKNWEFTPRIYKIFAAASVFNLLALIFFAHTSLLTAKGCDTPFVGRVCEVLDTVYVGSLLFGTQREYVDAAYDKTDLGDADITFVDVSGETPPLSYPDGYFQIANPNEYQAMLDQANNPAPPIDMSGFPTDLTTTPSTGNSLIDTKPVIPKINPNVIDGDLPTIDDPDPSFPDSGRCLETFYADAPLQSVSMAHGAPFVAAVDETGLADPPISRTKGPGMGRIRTPRTTPVTPKPTPDPKAQVADKKVDPPAKVDPTDPTDAVTINREPLKVFGKGVAEKLDKKEVDLSKNFKVVAEAVLTADGKLDTSIDKKTKQKKSRILTAAGDPQMVTVVTEAIAAVGDSGWLGYLRTLGIEKINFTFTQTDDQLLISITSEQL